MGTIKLPNVFVDPLAEIRALYRLHLRDNGPRVSFEEFTRRLDETERHQRFLEVGGADTVGSPDFDVSEEENLALVHLMKKATDTIGPSKNPNPDIDAWVRGQQQEIMNAPPPSSNGRTVPKQEESGDE